MMLANFAMIWEYCVQIGMDLAPAHGADLRFSLTNWDHWI